MKQISFFVHDLSINPVGRVLPFARALESVCDVEILGLLVEGATVYPPYQHLAAYKTIRIQPAETAVTSALAELASMATSDVLYAAKPLPTTLVPAFLAAGCPRDEWTRICGDMLQIASSSGNGNSTEEERTVRARLVDWRHRRTKPIILDVDDDEWAVPREWPGVNSQRLIQMFHSLAMTADRFTVSSR